MHIQGWSSVGVKAAPSSELNARASKLDILANDVLNGVDRAHRFD
jgi:hypothetical protein